MDTSGMSGSKSSSTACVLYCCFGEVRHRWHRNPIQLWGGVYMLLLGQGALLLKCFIQGPLHLEGTPACACLSYESHYSLPSHLIWKNPVATVTKCWYFYPNTGRNLGLQLLILPCHLYYQSLPNNTTMKGRVAFDIFSLTRSKIGEPHNPVLLRAWEAVCMLS